MGGVGKTNQTTAFFVSVSQILSKSKKRVDSFVLPTLPVRELPRALKLLLHRLPSNKSSGYPTALAVLTTILYMR
ncbi:hypothetical protein V6N12_015631 [Hibiscus sabdariffa]|uniref:Uncharacterized protein n=1 Tax=Hibiscus sabdariffa TaxID=183260 RepID=A0ABR2DNR5_9ROSI